MVRSSTSRLVEKNFHFVQGKNSTKHDKRPMKTAVHFVKIKRNWLLISIDYKKLKLFPK
jgi:hypothetical protein